MPARRILSPAQMAILVEEDVLPRASQESRASGDGDGDGEEGEVVAAGRVSVAPSAALAASTSTSNPKEKRRSWIPRFSWLLNPSSSPRNSCDIEEGEEGGLLLFDAGRCGRSPGNSISSPSPPLLSPLEPAPVAGATMSIGGSGSGVLGGVGASASGGGDGNGNGMGMHEFGARPLLPFLAAAARSSSRLGNRNRVGATGPGSRPISGASHLSSDGTGGTGGSGKSGGTVFTDARETLSTRGGGGEGVCVGARVVWESGCTSADTSRGTRTRGGTCGGRRPARHARTCTPRRFRDELAGVVAPLHQTVSKDSAASGSGSGLGNTTLGGSSTSGQGSSSTLATTTTAPTEMMMAKPERAYAYPHGPPGLGFVGDSFVPTAGNEKGNGKNGNGNGSVGSWDAAGLELGLARPPSNERLGTFGSANVVPVPVAVPAPGIHVVGASTSSSLGATGNGNATAGGGGERRSPFMRPGAGSLPFVEGRSSAPHLSLDLDDAPPGAEGRSPKPPKIPL
ncbi:hypothetical protein B0H14DRAFT_1447360 [Mycena olivaceomarginata]|nr:hypothetical protein B0H14DRAFT_1447360 [Mycena olivaceomarginata]